MDQDDPLLGAFRQAAQPTTAGAVETLIREGSDEELVHVNALAFAADRGLAEEDAIAAFLHASRLGLFELSWNVLCPSCSGVLDANATLKSIRQASYHCAFCSVDTEPTLDDQVEVTFTVSPRVRRIAAHDPNGLGFWDYQRQVFFGSGVVLASGQMFGDLARDALLESVELGPGERMILALQLPAAAAIVFDPVTHTAHVLTPAGEPTAERQDLAVVFDGFRPPLKRSELKPGPLRLTFDNRTDGRVLPGIFVEGEQLAKLIGGRRPFLSAKRLLSNQTFRDIYRTDALDIDQRLKILSLTFLFTDLKGSTELYERVGDLIAYDLVRDHFRVLNEIVAAESGAVVKTIGDAVMATFAEPGRAVAAALRMRESMRLLNQRRQEGDLILKIGVHEGPCLAVSLNDRQDYFGQTVNIASRVQQLAEADTIFATEPVVRDAASAKLLDTHGVTPTPRPRSLRGIGDRLPVFELA